MRPGRAELIGQRRLDFSSDPTGNLGDSAQGRRQGSQIIEIIGKISRLDDPLPVVGQADLDQFEGRLDRLHATSLRSVFAAHSSMVDRSHRGRFGR